MRRLILLALCAAAFCLLSALPAAAQPGCPYQFPSCTTACKCNTPCFTPCCNGPEAKLCNEVLCENFPQCSGGALILASAKTVTPPLLATDDCQATASPEALPVLVLALPAEPALDTTVPAVE
ncbi:MAG TPA: hypothetical protein VKU40_12655 [Thermoanaerobaculia bacterium]|nr:hypothetical protein [Thermoanaerobaculia bacterium]